MSEIFDKGVKRGLVKAWEERVRVEGVEVASRPRRSWFVLRLTQAFIYFSTAGFGGFFVGDLFSDDHLGSLVSGLFVLGGGFGCFHWVMSGGRDSAQLSPTPVSSDEMRGHAWRRVGLYWGLVFGWVLLAGFWASDEFSGADVVRFWSGYLCTILAGAGVGLWIGLRFPRGKFGSWVLMLLFVFIFYGSGFESVWVLMALVEVYGISPLLAGEGSFWPVWVHWVVCGGLGVAGLVRIFCDWRSWGFRRGEWKGISYTEEEVKFPPLRTGVVKSAGGDVEREDLVRAFAGGRPRMAWGVDWMLWRFLTAEQRVVWGVLGWKSLGRNVGIGVLLLWLGVFGEGVFGYLGGELDGVEGLMGVCLFLGVMMMAPGSRGCDRLFLNGEGVSKGGGAVGGFPISIYSAVLGRVKEGAVMALFGVPLATFAWSSLRDGLGFDCGKLGMVGFGYLGVLLGGLGYQVLLIGGFEWVRDLTRPVVLLSWLGLGGLAWRVFIGVFGSEAIYHRLGAGVRLGDWVVVILLGILVLLGGLWRFRDMRGDV